MRLKLMEVAENKQKEMVTAVRWDAGNRLFSCSDSQVVLRWGVDAVATSKTKVAHLDSYPTCMDVFSAQGGAGRGGAGGGGATLAVGCSDGTLRLVNENGRVEKTVAAHAGAVTAVRWNGDGTALCTAGEDGVVKHWSPTGNIRSKLCQADRVVYAVAWSPDSQAVAFCSGRHVTIKPLQVSAKVTRWKAHDATVLAVDWNPVNNLLLTGGEDCRYKTWDAYGRLRHASRPAEYSVTSVAWCPHGGYFAAGGFNSLSLCDATGWVHSRGRTASGSLMAVSWTADGTQLAAAGAAGSVVLARVVDRALSWRQYEVSLNDDNQVLVRDVLNESGFAEELEFSDRVIELSMAYGHLVVATTKTCYVYAADSLGTPAVFEVGGVVSLIQQSERHFLLVDNARGVQVFGYDGRPVGAPRVRGLNPARIRAGNLALCNDAVAVVDPVAGDHVHLLDARSGKPVSDPVRHTLEVASVAFSQAGAVNERKLAFVDANRDLYLARLHSSDRPMKLCGMVDSVRWNASADVLAAVSDGHLRVWHYPNAAFVDPDLAELVCSTEDASALGKRPSFVSFDEDVCTLRRSDGAVQAVHVSPFPARLQRYVREGAWPRAVRLCRLAKEPSLWACLAATAVSERELETAEVAFAAIDEVDKLEYVQRILAAPSPESRNAELALFRRRPDDAENILLQAGLVYQAVKLNLRLFRWPRALELALKHRAHVDTVVAYRGRYLAATRQQETLPAYQQAAPQVRVDWDAIRANEEREVENERARSSAATAGPAAAGGAYGGGGGGYAQPVQQQQHQQAPQYAAAPAPVQQHQPAPVQQQQHQQQQPPPQQGLYLDPQHQPQAAPPQHPEWHHVQDEDHMASTGESYEKVRIGTEEVMTFDDQGDALPLD